MKFKIDKGTGYLYCYSPNHYLANKAGKVMEHTYVMALSIGRPLKPDECVHHINRDKTDNTLINLQLMTQSEHMILHQIEDNGVKYLVNTCAICSIPINTTENRNQTLCSVFCSRKASRKFDLTREYLYILVWTKPTTEVATILDVSDVAVAKRCKKLNIPKPPRGYWAKVQAGQTPNIPELI